MKRALYLGFALFLASFVAADVQFEQTVAATATSQTITLGAPKSSISVYNCSDGTTPTCAGEEIYFRLFSCNDMQRGIVTTATTADTPLALGESVSFVVNTSSEASLYCAISIVCTAAETATVRLMAK